MFSIIAIVRRGGAATSRATQDSCMIIRLVQATTSDKVTGTKENTTVDTTSDISNCNRRHTVQFDARSRIFVRHVSFRVLHPREVDGIVSNSRSSILFGGVWKRLNENSVLVLHVI